MYFDVSSSLSSDSVHFVTAIAVSRPSTEVTSSVAIFRLGLPIPEGGQRLGSFPTVVDFFVMFYSFVVGS